MSSQITFRSRKLVESPRSLWASRRGPHRGEGKYSLRGNRTTSLLIPPATTAAEAVLPPTPASAGRLRVLLTVAPLLSSRAWPRPSSRVTSWWEKDPGMKPFRHLTPPRALPPPAAAAQVTVVTVNTVAGTREDQENQEGSENWRLQRRTLTKRRKGRSEGGEQDIRI